MVHFEFDCVVAHFLDKDSSDRLHVISIGLLRLAKVSRVSISARIPVDVQHGAFRALSVLTDFCFTGVLVPHEKHPNTFALQ